MEGADSISSDEIAKLNSLEKRVRDFKIIVSGNGTVEGGFGKLPDNESDPVKRLENLIRSVNSFTLSGSNVSISGSIDDGFIIS